MPDLDVSDVLLDPTLADRFIVKRRPATTNEHGRVVTTPEIIPKVIGVVTAASPTDLDRLDDNQRMGRNLSVVTKFRLRGPATGYQPDIVVWYGNEYVVKDIQPYPQYGVGFIQAIVGSMDSMDNPLAAS